MGGRSSKRMPGGRTRSGPAQVTVELGFDERELVGGDATAEVVFTGAIDRVGDSAGGSRAETFLGLLFLAHRGRVRLDQDELFSDLWIARREDASGTPDGDGESDVDGAVPGGPDRAPPTADSTD